MAEIKRPQVLLLGNGLNRTFGGTSWAELMNLIRKNEDIPAGYVLQSPMPLQAVIVTNNHVGTAMKQHNEAFYGEIKQETQRDMLRKLLTIGFDHILTTNYSYELEAAALGCDTVTDYKLKKLQAHTSGSEKAEPKFLLHTYNEVTVDGVPNKIWHIHGEARKPDSMILGHYYYGSLLHRYKELFDKRGNIYYHTEQKGEAYQIKSWLDAFILGDVYVLGFGYELSEFDLWWLLNRKQREQASVGTVHFYEAAGDTPFDEKIALLKAFGAVPLDLDFHKTENRYGEFYHAAVEDIAAHMRKKEELLLCPNL